MANSPKTRMQERAREAVAQYGIHMTLLRNAIAARMGVGVTDMECLRMLVSKGAASPSELAANTGLTSGATTAMLDRLENAGLIERQPNPSDRRGTRVVLVKAAAGKMRQWFAPVRKAQDDLLATRSERELEIIIEFLEGFTRIWQEEIRKLHDETSAG
ncbi:MAG TPA: MarR family transcriptional regulator [Anaerolineales bacterium]|nr:MarR family transcriptional regulator [Anaerolineales bacterium]